jgi:hypothetical protein
LDSDDGGPLSGFEIDSDEEVVHLTDQVTRYVLPLQTTFVHLIIDLFLVWNLQRLMSQMWVPGIKHFFAHMKGWTIFGVYNMTLYPDVT